MNYIYGVGNKTNGREHNVGIIMINKAVQTSYWPSSAAEFEMVT